MKDTLISIFDKLKCKYIRYVNGKLCGSNDNENWFEIN